VVEVQPSLLLHAGKFIEPHMEKEHVSMDELQRALREHGVAECSDVALAVLEVDGSISCLNYDEIKPDANTHHGAPEIHSEEVIRLLKAHSFDSTCGGRRTPIQTSFPTNPATNLA
jgi:uncharacterized membrane protein YcaP (DUF421 family)